MTIYNLEDMFQEYTLNQHRAHNKLRLGPFHLVMYV